MGVGTVARRGYFGAYGGRFVPETVISALEELEGAYAALRQDRAFQARYQQYLHDYAGRPTPLFSAARLSQELGSVRIYLKREDLNHTGAHKINNALGQALLARRMGKTRLIAETGAGQHGVAGGSGRAFDWNLARGMSERFALILSGGLTPENVTQALDILRPFGVDVSSGVETDGQKDPQKIRNFIKQVRQWESAQ